MLRFAVHAIRGSPDRPLALDSAVPAVVLIGSVPVVLVVLLIVLVVVTDESRSVNPSWAATKLTLADVRRPLWKKCRSTR